MYYLDYFYNFLGIYNYFQRNSIKKWHECGISVCHGDIIGTGQRKAYTLSRGNLCTCVLMKIRNDSLTLTTGEGTGRFQESGKAVRRKWYLGWGLKVKMTLGNLEERPSGEVVMNLAGQRSRRQARGCWSPAVAAGAPCARRRRSEECRQEGAGLLTEGAPGLALLRAMGGFGRAFQERGAGQSDITRRSPWIQPGKCSG